MAAIKRDTVGVSRATRGLRQRESPSTQRRWPLPLYGFLTCSVAFVALVAFVGYGAPHAGAMRPSSRSSCAAPSGSVTLGLASTSDPTATENTTLASYQAGIDALNREGGLGGCRVDAVVGDCAAFAGRRRILAVLAIGTGTASPGACSGEADTSVFEFGVDGPITCGATKRDPGSRYAPAGISVCRFGSFIGIWHRSGLFPPGAKVGIVVVDDASGLNRKLAADIWAPELDKRNIAHETIDVPRSTTPGEFSAMLASVSDGLSRFVADGVNVVLFTPSGGQAIAGFMPAAAARNFFPDYGLTSSDGLRLAGTVGSAAIRKALAISWLTADLPLTDQQRLPANSAASECASWVPSTATSLAGASPSCDFLNILQRALAGATRPNGETLRTRIEALGTSFVSSLTYGGATKFGPNRYDGAVKARVLDFNTATLTFQPKLWVPTYTIP